jgi:ankyrin repeat protein
MGVVHFLVQSGADVNAISSTGTSPLSAACRDGQYEVARYLVVCGAHLNQNLRALPLMAAVESCQFRTVLLLLHKGADVNLKSSPEINSHDTALQMAVCIRDYDMVKLLLNASAKGDVESVDGRFQTEIFVVKRKSPKGIANMTSRIFSGRRMMVSLSQKSQNQKVKLGMRCSSNGSAADPDANLSDTSLDVHL